MEQYKRTITTISASIRRSFSHLTRFLKRFIDHHPLGSFLGILTILVIFIIAGNILRRPPKSPEAKTPAPKAVEVYSIGQAPRLKMTAQIEKSGVVKIISQSGGIIQKINKREGESVRRGEQLFWISTNAQGGTAQSVARQIAQKNYDFVRDNLDVQKEIIGKQRDIANAQNTQASDLRDIAKKSAEDSQSLVNLDNDIINSLNAQIDQLVATNVATSSGGGVNDALILQVKQAKAGIQTGLLNVQNALRNAQYQSGDNNAPAALANLQKDLTLKQLDIQEKTLDLNKQISYLNLCVAQITESLMYPASPVTGIVERIHVQPGQTITPGMLLATVTGDKTSTTAVLYVSGEIAKNISVIENSKITLTGKTIELAPTYISHEPTQGTLYSVLFRLPDEVATAVGNGSSIGIDVPVGQAKTTSIIPYVPLDAIYQTEAASFLYVAAAQNNGSYVAHSRKVELGEIYGSFVEVKKGLEENDQVIMNRDVVDGDVVTLE